MLQRKAALKLAPKVDTEFAGLIAPLTADERQQLEANLIAHGCRDALVVWRGLLLDGHNRLEICNRHGLAYETTEIDLPDRESAKLWIEENQIGRRNLTTDQRAALAYRMMQRRVAVSKKQRATKAGSARSVGNLVVHVSHQAETTPRQRERTARELQISTRKIREIASLAKTDPGIVDRIANAEVSLRDAKEAMLERVRQRNITAALKTHVRGEGIHTGHMRQLFRLLDDDSVDLFITDPPWERDALPLYAELGKLAQQKLKPGGFCLVLCGQMYLDEIIGRLSESLDWYWLCAVRFDGSHARIWPRKVSNSFKPILMFTKRPGPKQAENEWISDLLQRPNADKAHHKNRQTADDSQYFIERLTLPGQLVVDPFVGGSTTPEICKKIGRRFMGTELNPGTAAAARVRVANAAEKVDRSIENGIVREIGASEAKPIIEKYEWLKTMPAIVHHCYGIYFDGAIAGVVVYGIEYAENLGVWDKYGYSGKIICLARGACLPWAHEHTASKLIRTSMRMLPEKYKVITGTVDNTAGEVGTIYQACGFDYVGVMSNARSNRASILLPDGKHMSEREAYRIYGTRSIEKLEDMGLTVASVPRKGRYFAFRGSKKERKELRKAIEHLTKPYPKRTAGSALQDG
jgi:hypothetical protein